MTAERTSDEAAAQVARPPGRPRSADADRAIIDATLDLLIEAGVAALAVEQVAARAGVGKATIYRRWPNKEALILDALSALDEPLPELPGTSVRDDLVVIAQVMGRRNGPLTSRLYAWMVAEGSRNPEIARTYKNLVLERRRESVREVIRRGIRTGELRRDLDVETLLLLVVAPMLVYTMHWHQGEEAPPGLAARLIDATLDGVRGPADALDSPVG